MKKIIITLVFMLFSFYSWAQSKTWTASDKFNLLYNYNRSKAELNLETQGLTHEQWTFKEGPDKWTIAQVVEHLYNWSLITQQNVRYSIQLGENPELAKKSLSDSLVTTFIWEERPHISPNHTLPTGLITDDNNRLIFNIKYDEIISFIEKSDLNFRNYIRDFNGEYMEDLVQQFTIHYGHVERHIRQIKRIKANPGFPK
jgi:hypothetical protein